MKRIVITGSNGLLGQKLVKLFLSKGGYEIYALSRGENRIHHKEGYTYYSIDLSNRPAFQQTLAEIAPSIIIHTAAMTNVDACELNKEECDIMNIEVVRHMLDYCRDNNVYLVHLSTDFIFDGLKGGIYNEEDAPTPVNYYGRSKLISEQLIEETDIEYAILRTVLVYGLVDANDRSNIVLWVKSSLESHKDINVVTDQLRMPTFAEDLAEACYLVVEKRVSGVFNVSSNELMSIYDIAIAVADAFGLNKKLIHPVETKDLSLPAKRPLSTGFDLHKSNSTFNLPSHSFKERLQSFKHQLDTL